MSVLNVIRFPNPQLRNIAKPVEKVDAKIKQLVSDMYETMYAEKGVGLAATQVNIHKRIVVADCANEEESPQPYEFINPEIIKSSEEFHIHQEGCLSVPEIYAEVERAKYVTVKALNKDGKEFTLDCEGLLAVCIQHEIDHLNGKLFVDYLTAAKRSIIRDKMKKFEKRLIRENKSEKQST